jgi:hypothetical protein
MKERDRSCMSSSMMKERTVLCELKWDEGERGLA